MSQEKGYCHSNKTQICYHTIKSQMIKVHLWNDYLGEVNWNDFQLPYSFFLWLRLSSFSVEEENYNYKSIGSHSPYTLRIILLFPTVAIITFIILIPSLLPSGDRYIKFKMNLNYPLNLTCSAIQNASVNEIC